MGRRWTFGETTDVDGRRTSAVPALPRRAASVAYGSAAVATVLFIPLHLVWALDIASWAGSDRFHEWHQDGGGTYLFLLNMLLLFPGALALALVPPWGLVFPRYLPAVAGRPVPRVLLIVPAVGLAVFLVFYAAFAAVVLPQQWNAPAVVFDPWVVVLGLAQFPIWAIGLLIATRSYARRTASDRRSAGPEALPQLPRIRVDGGAAGVHDGRHRLVASGDRPDCGRTVRVRPDVDPVRLAALGAECGPQP
jgi:hypothetical protein